MVETQPPLKSLIWIGSSRKDFQEFPDPVKDGMGYALFIAQQGGKHDDAKPLKGFGGAGVVEIVSAFRGDAFRTMYTVQLAGTVYVLHAFQKKSKTGRATPKGDMELVRQRLAQAERLAKEGRL
jgi:phage-related protein